MKIVRSIVGLLFLGSLMFFSSCNKSSTTAILGDWQTQAPFAGIPRSGAVSFVIGDKAFVGLGYDGQFYQNDFQFYDVKKQIWDTIAPFPGLGREQAIAFSLNGKGYVGTGYNRDSAAQLGDFWEYDPATYKWKKLKDFSGGARSGSVAFSDGNYGYVGTGYNKYWFEDFWQYNADADSWIKIPPSRGSKRQFGMTMNINGKTYLFGGTNNGSYIYDLWEFDPAALALGQYPWTNRTPLTTDAQYNNFKATVGRASGVAFSLNNKGYVTSGTNGQLLVTTFQYDPSNQTFTQMTSFEGASRTQAQGFVVGDETTGFHAFLTTGLQGTVHFDDMMEFLPSNAYIQGN